MRHIVIWSILPQYMMHFKGVSLQANLASPALAVRDEGFRGSLKAFLKRFETYFL
jgi:hypothetical protein